MTSCLSNDKIKLLCDRYIYDKHYFELIYNFVTDYADKISESDNLSEHKIDKLIAKQLKLNEKAYILLINYRDTFLNIDNIDEYSTTVYLLNFMYDNDMILIANSLFPNVIEIESDNKDNESITKNTGRLVIDGITSVTPHFSTMDFNTSERYKLRIAQSDAIYVTMIEKLSANLIIHIAECVTNKDIYWYIFSSLLPEHICASHLTNALGEGIALSANKALHSVKMKCVDERQALLLFCDAVNKSNVSKQFIYNVSNKLINLRV